MLYLGVRRLSVLLAAGPYSTSDSLSYEPLTDLVQQIQQTKPDVCILVRLDSYPVNIFFVLKMLSAFYVCCIYSSKFQYRFFHGNKQHEP